MTTPLYNSSTRTREFTKRRLGHCRVCKVTKTDSVHYIERVTETYGICGMKTRRALSGNEPIVLCACGRQLAMKWITGTKNETPCDARCTEAKGHKCECSCGGANHGNGHSTEGITGSA